MHTYSFKAIDDHGRPLVTRSGGKGDPITSMGFSGPYFQPTKTEIKELARDLHYVLCEKDGPCANETPLERQTTRDILVAKLAELLQVNMARSHG